MELTFQRGTGNKVLRTKSKEIKKLDSKLRKFIKAMEKEMFKENGVGLAAPQVGHNIRVILTRLNPGTPQEIVTPMINPKILKFSAETAEDEEGCLSVPEIWGVVERSKEITVQFQTNKGNTQTLKLIDLNARIIQHEIDHLDGILFVDKAKNTYEKPRPDQTPL